MTRLINLVNGLTKDNDGGIVTWRELLTREFLWPVEFKHCIISTVFDKATGRGHYSMLGVREGNLLMRDGNAPAPAGGLINMLFSNVAFSYSEDWRFSHLFESQDDAKARE